MTKYNNEKRIALFKNPKYEENKTKNPVMRGIVEVEGKEYNVSIWARTYTDKNGEVQRVWRGELQEYKSDKENTVDDEKIPGEE